MSKRTDAKYYNFFYFSQPELARKKRKKEKKKIEFPFFLFSEVNDNLNWN